MHKVANKFAVAAALGTLLLVGVSGCSMFANPIPVDCNIVKTQREAGKTDPQILREIFQACGKELKFEEHTEHIFELYLGVLEDEIHKSRYYIVHEGVVELLEALVAAKQTQR